jgi:hypothetical protein
MSQNAETFVQFDADIDLDKHREKVYSALNVLYPRIESEGKYTCVWVRTLTPSYVVFEYGSDNILKLPYTLGEDGSIAIDSAKAEKVEMTYTPIKGTVSESMTLTLDQASPKGLVWDVTILREGITDSPNVDLSQYGLRGKRGRFEYPVAAVSEAVDNGLFENVPVTIRSESDHLNYANGRTAVVPINEENANMCGIIKGTYMGTNAEGRACAKGKLHLRNNKAGRAMRSFLQGRAKASESNTASYYGLSWTGETEFDLVDPSAQYPTLRVKKILEVVSVDPVVRGNAGGEITRAAESYFNNSSPTMAKDILKLKTRLIARAAEAEVEGADEANAKDALPQTLVDYAAKMVWEKMPAASDIYDSLDEVKGLPEEKLIKLFDKYCASSAPAQSGAASEGKPNEQTPPTKTDQTMTGNNSEVQARIDAIQISLATAHLETSLARTNLPEVSKTKLREQFKGKAAETSQIDAAIRAEQEYAAALSRTNSPVKVTLDEPDKMKRGFEALLFSPNDARAAETFKSIYGYNPRESRGVFSGLNEAWRIIHGMDSIGSALFIDREGGRARNAEAFSGDAATNLVADAMHRRFIAEYRSLIQYDDYKKIVRMLSVNDFRDYNAYKFGDVASFSQVTGTNDYQEVTISASEKTTVAVSRYGGILSLGIEQLRNDDLNYLRDAVVGLARTAKRQIYETAFNMLYNAFTTNYIDSTAVLHSSRGNASTAALDGSAVITGRIAMMKAARLGSSKPLGIAPRYLIYGSGNFGNAYKILTPAAEKGNLVATADQSLRLEGIEVPHWFYPYWFLLTDPEDAGFISAAFLDGNEEPELQQEQTLSGVNFTAESVRWRCKFTMGFAYDDFRTCYGSTNS